MLRTSRQQKLSFDGTIPGGRSEFPLKTATVVQRVVRGDRILNTVVEKDMLAIIKRSPILHFAHIAQPSITCNAFHQTQYARCRFGG